MMYGIGWKPHWNIQRWFFFKEQVPLESVRSLFSRIKFFRCFFCFSSVLDMLLCDVFLECRIDGFSTGQKKIKAPVDMTWNLLKTHPQGEAPEVTKSRDVDAHQLVQ